MRCPRLPTCRIKIRVEEWVRESLDKHFLALLFPPCPLLRCLVFNPVLVTFMYLYSFLCTICLSICYYGYYYYYCFWVCYSYSLFCYSWCLAENLSLKKSSNVFVHQSCQFPIDPVFHIVIFVQSPSETSTCHIALISDSVHSLDIVSLFL